MDCRLRAGSGSEPGRDPTTLFRYTPERDRIDITRDENPFRDFDIIYVPYCDGSVFIGDRIVDYDGEQTYHHGLRNLSVGVDAMLANFPNPSRIVVAGSSAGGGHTVLLSEEFYSQEIEGVNIRDWTEAFLDDSPDWTDIVE
ncbi:MAG: pectin acetylesterase-family hydrolase [bacterium]